MKLKSFAEGKWYESSGKAVDLLSAVTGEKVAEISSDGLDFKSLLSYGRTIGSQQLRKMTFHQRGRMLKELAIYLMSRKKEFYPVSHHTGATKVDSWIDIEGGISTLFIYASKGRRELPDETFYVDGQMEAISKSGSFIGHHIAVPLEGVAVHINAFNFPCWGMLEKIAPALLAGVACVVKPASQTAYLTEKMVQVIIESKILPDGALQLISGSTGDLIDHLTFQDVLTFTGSATTGLKLKSNSNILQNSIRYNMEADSLNCSILGEDVTPEKPEFDLFIKEVTREMTVKAGQKCTAIRRTIVPEKLVDDVSKALQSKLAKITIGDPSLEEVRMGPLASLSQVTEVQNRVQELKQSAELVFGGNGKLDIKGKGIDSGAWFPPTLLMCNKPFQKTEIHDIEAFGPVSTIMPYKSTEEAIELAKLGKGSLVASLFTADNKIAKEVTLGTAAYHGRLMIINEKCSKESTGHGSPLPHLVHGGPGRAGGGEELGGIRSVLHYMQRTALQGSPETISHIINEYLPGANQNESSIHPFKKYYDELHIGDTLTTHRRTITEADVVNFAGVSGDFFYAHTDEIAAANSFFKRRVAHGYFVISAAAGLFVWPGEGPVLANYGLENLRFVEPVYIGDTIYLKLVCKQKTEKEKREDEKLQGVVEWAVQIFNQDDILVATYSILTLVERKK